MDGDSTLLLIFIVCVALSAFFSSSESSFATMNKIRIKQKADDGNKKAHGVLYILDRFDKALTTLLIGNNITKIAGAAVFTIIATDIFKVKQREIIKNIVSCTSCKPLCVDNRSIQLF